MSLAQQASAAMVAGLTITLSGTFTPPATVFSADTATQSKLNMQQGPMPEMVLIPRQAAEGAADWTPRRMQRLRFDCMRP